jgi:hypothetical protein
MVQPIDYTMDVLSPMEGYMQGLKFGEGIQTGRLNRELLQSQEGREQEKFAIAKQDRARSIASAQAAQQNAAAAQAGLVDYVNKLEAGTATSADLRAAIVKFPKMAETFQAFSNSVSTERLNNEMKHAKQLAFALTKDPEQAKLLLQERADAAEASGDQKTAAIAKAQMLQIDQNFNAVLMQALMPLVTTMKPDEFDKFFTKVLGVGGDETKAVSPIGKIAEDVKNKFIPRSVLDSAIAVDKAAADGGLTLQQEISEEARLRGEYFKRTEDLSAAERNFSIIETSAADNSGAGDIALVTSFMKMLDPGSVVRETEFAQAADTSGLLGKLKSAVTKIEDGKFLTPQQRIDFQRLASKYLEAANVQEQGVRNSYQAIIDNYGLNPVNVFGARAATAAAPSGAPAAAEVQPAPADAASGSIPPSFMSDEGVKKAAAAAGVTPEEMWEVMPDDMRAKYGR